MDLGLDMRFLGRKWQKKNKCNSKRNRMRRLCRSAPLWRGDADGIGAAGADGAASDGLEGLVHTDLNGRQIVVAAAEGETVAGKGRVGLAKEAENFHGRHGDLVVERCQLRWDCHRVKRVSGQREERVGGEAGAGAVGAPLVIQEAGVGVDVAEGGGIAWCGLG